MSWLMSAKRRAREGLLQAVGAHRATEDAEFDLKLKNFTDYANHLQKVKDAMDLWIEAFDTFGAATLMLSEAFKGFFAFKPMRDEDTGVPLSSPYLPVAEGFSDIAKKLNRTILPSVRQLFEIRCLQPTAAILAMVGPIDALLSERRTVLLDFDSYRAKIEKEHAAGRDSRHPMVIKKAMKLDDVAKQLYSLNSTILASFVEFEKARSVTMGPEFTSFMACFYHFSSYSAELSGKVLPDMPQVASSLYILESFIGQSFNSPAKSEEVTTFTATDVPNEATSKHEPLEVVTERSEYAGGDYGGYNTSSTVLPASYKDEEIEQQIEHEQALSEVPDIDDAATSETSEFTASTSAALEPAQSPGEVSGSALLPEGVASVSKEKAIDIATIRSLLPTSAPTPPARRPSGDQSVSSAGSSTPVPPPPAASEPSSPAAPISVTKPPKPAPSTPTTPVPAPAPAVEATPPKRSSIFSSFFSSSRAPLPVAKSVPAEVLASTAEEEEVPIAEATIDTRPEKPPKPSDLSSKSETVAESPTEQELDCMTEEASEVQPETKPKPDRSSSPVPGRTAEGESPTSYRNTIALARGSVEGDLSADVSARKPMDASPAPPLKPIKPPKQPKPSGDASVGSGSCDTPGSLASSMANTPAHSFKGMGNSESSNKEVLASVEEAAASEEGAPAEAPAQLVTEPSEATEAAEETAEASIATAEGEAQAVTTEASESSEA